MLGGLHIQMKLFMQKAVIQKGAPPGSRLTASRLPAARLALPPVRKQPALQAVFRFTQTEGAARERAPFPMNDCNVRALVGVELAQTVP